MATAAGSIAFGQFAADQLSLDQELAIDRFHAASTSRKMQIRQLFELQQICSRKRLLDRRAIMFGAAANEGKIRQIAGQANAAADDDVRLGARAAQPFAALLGEFDI